MTEQEASIAQPAHQQTQQEIQQVQELAGATYLVEGTGTPIVLVHGVGGAARQFGPVLTRLGRRRQAIAWDLPGHGGSAPLPLVSIDSLAAALGAFLEALGLDRPVLLGHSLGGMVVQRLVAERPHCARALVLSQTTAAFGGRDPAWADAFIRERLGPLDEGRSMADLAPAMARASLGDDGGDDGGDNGGDAGGDAALALAVDCIARTPDSSYRDTITAMRGFDLRGALPRIAVPTLLIAGTADRAAPLKTMERMAEEIPGSRLTVLETGHLAHLQAPDAIVAAVEDFLAGLD